MKRALIGILVAGGLAACTKSQAPAPSGTPSTSAPETTSGARIDEAMPAIPVPPGDPGKDGVLDPRIGPRASRTRVQVVFRKEATIEQANAAIARAGGRVIGTIPALRTFVIEAGDSTTAWRALKSDAAVSWVAYDFVLAAQTLPPPTERLLFPQNAGADFRWDDRGVPYAPNEQVQDGNWGLKAIRMPQAWNLLTHAYRTSYPDRVPRVAVFDSGFNDQNGDGWDDHEDFFRYLRVLDGNLETGAPKGDHGTHVAGIIGARSDNDWGIAGICPLLNTKSNENDPRFLGVAVGEAGGSYESFFVDALARVLERWPDLRVLNISQGLDFGDEDINNLESDRKEHVSAVAARLRALIEKYPRLVVVCSAGNDWRNLTPERHALFNSPFCCAGLFTQGLEFDGTLYSRPKNFIVVEACDARLTKCDFSFVGGHVSAPGIALSTVQKNKFQYEAGTSQAAPHVAGLVAYLLSLDPDLPLARLIDVVKSPELQRAVTPLMNEQMPAGAGGPAAMIDAFAMAMAIDWDGKLQKALCDVDDGTEDGNLRKRDFEALYGSDPDEIRTKDRRRGDGKVNMRDFRAYRDAWLVDWARAGMEPVILDGKKDHFKRDLNFDGVVWVDGRAVAVAPPAGKRPKRGLEQAPKIETIYSRYDFNGDGILMSGRVAQPKARFKGRDLSDLEVMAEVWDENTEGTTHDESENVSARKGDAADDYGQWTRTSLLLDRDGDGVIDYLRSFDLHYRLAAEVAKLEEIAIESPAEKPLFRKTYTTGSWGAPHVVTIPLYGPLGSPAEVAIRVTLLYPTSRKESGEGRAKSRDGQVKVTRLVLRARPGEDFALNLDWNELSFAPLEREATAEVFPPEKQWEAWTTHSGRDHLYATPPLDDEAWAASEVKSAAGEYAVASAFRKWISAFGTAQPAWPSDGESWDRDGQSFEIWSVGFSGQYEGVLRTVFLEGRGR